MVSKPKSIMLKLKIYNFVYYPSYTALTLCFDKLNNRYIPRHNDKIIRNVPSAEGCQFLCQEEEAFKCVFAEYVTAGGLATNN